MSHIWNSKRTREVECSIFFFGKSNFQQEEGSFHQQIGLKFKEETSKVCHWSRALYGAKTWTLWEVDQKYVGSFETC